jgi:hypothetical protein
MSNESQQPALAPEEVVHPRPYIAILLKGEPDDIVQAVPDLRRRASQLPR